MCRYDYSDSNRHGTRCAGQVAATPNNSFCSIGIAFNAQIGGRMFSNVVFSWILKNIFFVKDLFKCTHKKSSEYRHSDAGWPSERCCGGKVRDRYSSPLLFRGEYSPHTILPSYSGLNTLLTLSPTYSGVHTLLILFSLPIQGWILSSYSSPLLFRGECFPYTLLPSSSGLNTLLIIFELFSPPFQGWSEYSSIALSKEWCILGLYTLSLVRITDCLSVFRTLIIFV